MILAERTPLRPPCEGDGCTVVYQWNIFNGAEHIAFRSRRGWSLRQLAPRSQRRVICLFNGEPALEEDWDYEPVPSDHVRFVILPDGPLTPYLGYLLVAAIAAIAVVVLLPTPNVAATGQGTSEASPTYSAGFDSNSARLGQTLPVLYGRHIITPDFASHPYVEYDDAGDEFYHALFCLGMLDQFTLESVNVDDTPLSHFTDVETQLVGPAQSSSTVTLIRTGVVSAPEIADNELLYGVNVGPITACGPGLRVTQIGIDVIFPRGLYYAEDNGTLSNKTASWLAEARRITDTGAPSGSWVLLGSHSLTLASNRIERRTYTYSVAEGRYEVRMRREDERDERSRVGHDIGWHGLRGYTTVSAPLESAATFLAVRVKATSQLSSQSQRKFTCIIRRWLPTWNPSTGWSAPVETRSIAWALADVLRNTDYGGSLPDYRIDLQSLYELDAVWAARGDTFNGVFDSRITIWQALQTIALAGRALPLMRGSVVTFVRDGPQDLPVALFNMRNIERGSFNVEYTTVAEDAPDGVEVEFFDDVKWASDWVTVPLPGVVGDPINPEKKRVRGVTNSVHAQREALYYAAAAVYRTCSTQFTTEMEGFLPTYGNLIAVAHDVSGWGLSGDITAWDAGSLVATCSERLVWTDAAHYAVLSDEFGDMYGPYRVEPGDESNTMHFLEAPEIVPYTDTERQRTIYSVGPASNFAKYCNVVQIDPQGGERVTIRAIIDDARVHSADAHLVGGGGSGGAGRIARYAPDTVPAYDAASAEQQQFYGFYSDEDGTVGAAADPGPVYSL